MHLTTPNGRIGYDILGAGRTPVVALPGIGDARSSYRLLAPLLAEQDCTVYLVDLRGHGSSDATFPSYTAADIGDDVVALLDALDVRDALVLGNSIGAAAAVHAALHSDRVGRLVSLSGFVGDPPYFRLLRWLLGALFRRPWGVWVWGMYRKTLFATLPADFDAHEAALLAMLREPHRLRAVRRMLCASKADIEARLGEVRIPALIAMGAQDPDFPDPAAEAERQAERLGGDNTVVRIDGAGHYPQVEQPAATARAILDFRGTV